MVSFSKYILSLLLVALNGKLSENPMLNRSRWQSSNQGTHTFGGTRIRYASTYAEPKFSAYIAEIISLTIQLRLRKNRHDRASLLRRYMGFDHAIPVISTNFNFTFLHTPRLIILKWSGTTWSPQIHMTQFVMASVSKPPSSNCRYINIAA